MEEKTTKAGSVEDLQYDDKNFNAHTEFGMGRLEKSLRKFGAGRSILVDKDNRIIAGNGIVETAVNVGLNKTRVIETTGDEIVVVKRVDVSLDSKEGREMALADNATASADLAWNFDVLAEVADAYEIDTEGWGVSLSLPDPEDLKQNAGGSDQNADGSGDGLQAKEDGFDVDANGIPKRCKLDDVWQLGSHRLICGDCTSREVLARLMDGERAELVFTDPPYGMKKEKDGVLNDNLNFDDLLEFNRKWIPVSFENLTENGSWYCWGIDEPLMDIYCYILRPMKQRGEITFRNLITWAKGGEQGAAFGVTSPLMRQYCREDEKCLFVMRGVQGFNNNTEHYNSAFDGILNYMTAEAEKVNLTPKLLKEITGVQMYGHWFSKSQFTIITREHYEKLQNYFNGKAFALDYKQLRGLRGEDSAEFTTLRDAILNGRTYFDNTHDKMTNVWRYGTMPFGEIREQYLAEMKEAGGHVTPKPQFICQRAIKTSSREGGLVLDMFGGSGSTLIACEQLRRRCNIVELDPHFCDVILARWEKLTGGRAVKL